MDKERDKMKKKVKRLKETYAKKVDEKGMRKGDY